MHVSSGFGNASINNIQSSLLISGSIVFIMNSLASSLFVEPPLWRYLMVPCLSNIMLVGKPLRKISLLHSFSLVDRIGKVIPYSSLTLLIVSGLSQVNDTNIKPLLSFSRCWSSSSASISAIQGWQPSNQKLSNTVLPLNNLLETVSRPLIAVNDGNCLPSGAVHLAFKNESTLELLIVANDCPKTTLAISDKNKSKVACIKYGLDWSRQRYIIYWWS